MIAVLVMRGLAVKNGSGRHQHYLNRSPNPLEQESKSVEWKYIGETVFLASVMFTRISICLFLLHIFGKKKMWRWGLHSVIGFVIIIGLPTLTIVLFECHPVRKIWQPSQARYLLAFGMRFRSRSFQRGCVSRSLFPSSEAEVADVLLSRLGSVRLDAGRAPHRLYVAHSD